MKRVLNEEKVEKLNFVTYDIEIRNCIPDRNKPNDPDFEYCKGWDDFQGMGIACIGAYESATDRYRVFTEGDMGRGFGEFIDMLLRADVIVGFNSYRFDNQLLCNDPVFTSELLRVGGKFRDLMEFEVYLQGKTYDILREVWKLSGLNPDVFNFRTHGGVGLDAIAGVTFNLAKTGKGDLAPILWQTGRYGECIDYCLNDVKLTVMLLECIINGSGIIHPKSMQTIHPDLPLVFEQMYDEVEDDEEEDDSLLEWGDEYLEEEEDEIPLYEGEEQLIEDEEEEEDDITT
jgi:DEAD/DEAH box helicase domain-containing protein